MRLSRWEQLREIYLSVPLISPMKDYYFTSGFGRRKDPFNKRWALHAGLDMSRPRKQEICSWPEGLLRTARPSTERLSKLTMVKYHDPICSFEQYRC